MYCIHNRAKLVGVNISCLFAGNESYGSLKSENVIRLNHEIFLLVEYWLIQNIKMSNQETLTEKKYSSPPASDTN